MHVCTLHGQAPADEEVQVLAAKCQVQASSCTGKVTCNAVRVERGYPAPASGTGHRAPCTGLLPAGLLPAGLFPPASALGPAVQAIAIAQPFSTV